MDLGGSSPELWHLLGIEISHVVVSRARIIQSVHDSSGLRVNTASASYQCMQCHV